MNCPAVLICLLALIPAASGWTTTTNPTLESDLFRSYDKRHRPVKKEATTTLVQVYLIINHIEHVDEREQTMLLHGTIWSTWADEYLTWSPSQYNHTYSISVEAWKVWQPSFALYNSAKGNAHWLVQMNSMPATINYMGRVHGVGSFTFHVTCQFDFTLYPFDEQECPIVLADWVYDLSKVNLSNPMPNGKPPVRLSFDPLSETPKRHVAGWEVMDTWLKHCFWGPSGCAERFPREGQLDTYWSMLEFGVRIKRHYPYYFLSMALPTLITALMTLLVFWLESYPLAIWISVFNLLLQYVYGWEVVRQLPPGNGSVPTIAKIYATNMLTTLLALTLHITMNFLLTGLLDKDTEVIPARVKQWVSRLAATNKFFSVPGLSLGQGQHQTGYSLFGEEADLEVQNPTNGLYFDNPLLEPANGRDKAEGGNDEVLIEMETLPGTSDPTDASSNEFFTMAPMVELELEPSTPPEQSSPEATSIAHLQQSEAQSTISGAEKDGRESQVVSPKLEKVELSKLESEFQLLRRMVFAVYLICFLFYYVPFLLF